MTLPSIAGDTGADKNPSELMHDKMKHGEHGHTPVDVADWPALPSLTLTAHKDAMAGWNLHLVPTNFDFAPD